MPTNEKWTEWLDEHGSRLLLFARQQARTEGSVSPEDILQEALVRLWQRLGEAPPLAYAFREIRRLAIDSARSLDRRKLREHKALETQNTPWFPAHTTLDAQDLLRSLPAEQAEVVVLKIWGGLSFREIGQATDSPTATAASRYRSALKKLQQDLANSTSPQEAPHPIAL